MGFVCQTGMKNYLKYGERFESEMMDLSKNVSLEDSLDMGWSILSECSSRTKQV